MGNIIRVIILIVLISSIVLLLVYVLNQKQVISPVPEEGAIRIIYLTPSPTVRITPPVTVTP
jgi:hypothetical protein